MGQEQNRFDRTNDFLILDELDLKTISVNHFNGKNIVADYLEGGFSNTNYLLKVDKEKYVIRISQNEKVSLGKELSVIELVLGTVKVPEILYEGKIHNYDYVILSFIPGKALSEIGLADVNCKKIYFEVGNQLAKIHSYAFGNSGIFNDKFEFTQVFKNFGQGYLDFIFDCLGNELAIERMGKALNEKVVKLIHRYSKEIKNLKQTNQLIHCDFNSKNILVEDTEVNGIIDWEFSASGSPLVDIGNFLRFENEHREEDIDSFIEGYYFGNGTLPDNWKDLSRIIDLGAMCEFIIRPEDVPLTIQTALAVFDKTVDQLG